MAGSLPDPVFLQGQRGNARVGSCYGHRTAQIYNRIKAEARERRTGKKVVLRYYARKLVNDDYIREFVVLNGHLDPTMFVETDAPDGGAPERWLRVEEDGRSVFYAPPGYTGGAIAWVHDKAFADRFESMVYESTKATIDLGDGV